MTIREALQKGKNQLRGQSPTAFLDAEVLLCHTMACTKELLIKSPERILKAKEKCTYDGLISERQAGKPIAYLTHEKEFYGRNFYVDERVLIPRPETEEMVEESLLFLRSRPDLKTVIDLGTGSGAIAITVGLELPDREIIGLDISKEALAVARKNAKKLGCKNVRLFESDLLSSLLTPHYSLLITHSSLLTTHCSLLTPLCILANLPYIGTKTNHFISAETDHFEPHPALYGGPDGLELYRRTWEQMKEMKLNVAALFMEIGFSQAETMRKEAWKTFPGYDFEIKYDLAGLPRLAILTKKG